MSASRNYLTAFRNTSEFQRKYLAQKKSWIHQAFFIFKSNTKQVDIWHSFNQELSGKWKVIEMIFSCHQIHLNCGSDLDRISSKTRSRQDIWNISNISNDWSGECKFVKYDNDCRRGTTSILTVKFKPTPGFMRLSGSTMWENHQKNTSICKEILNIMISWAFLMSRENCWVATALDWSWTRGIWSYNKSQKTLQVIRTIIMQWWSLIMMVLTTTMMIKRRNQTGLNASFWSNTLGLISYYELWW